MRETPRRTNRTVWSNPCRRFFLLLSLMPIWLGLAGWLGFTDSPDASFVSVVVGFLVAIFVAVPWLLYKRLTRDQEPTEEVGLLVWLEGQVETATGRLEAREFAIQALTALAAAALGMSLLAVVLRLAT
jgi:hypothetical protein